jgi:hypothetical protein
MKQQVTQAQLQAVVDRINRITGSPMQPYTDGKINIGNYHLSGAYGGVCLHRMHNQGGGVSSPLSTGHIPKRELLNLMHAYIMGLSEVVA